jgi:hypothetical protein
MPVAEPAKLGILWRGDHQGPRSLGQRAPEVGPILCQERHGLVANALPAGQHAASDRPAVRRLPLGGLRHRRWRTALSQTRRPELRQRRAVHYKGNSSNSRNFC